ncbi:hypothetical protein [Prevotella pectinovora]|uniref:hypothetical protein n=1 Tax=Prevotella pectinovora TaxID=1602169 RepID=UPI003A949010
MKNKIVRNFTERNFRIAFLFVFLMVTYLLSSCNSKREVKEIPVEIEWNTLENEYFSLEYPSNYVVEGDFEVGVDNMKSYSVDTTATNEIDILPRNPSKDKPWVHIVLSRSNFQLSLRDFMQFSIASKAYCGVEVCQMSDIDSTSFAGLPALSVTFAYPQEGGDTLVQRQTIVQLPDYKLYYININCHKEIVNDSQKLAPAFEMLETLKFK